MGRDNLRLLLEDEATARARLVVRALRGCDLDDRSSHLGGHGGRNSLGIRLP
jgi:hypothetical protein